MCEPGLRITQSVMQYGVATEERGWVDAPDLQEQRTVLS